MRKKLFITVILAALALNVKLLMAQSADSLGTEPVSDAPAPGEIIDLQAQEIKVIVEAPQVKLYSNRIKPDFDDVHLKKSFIKEIVGEGEQVVFENLQTVPSEEIINVEDLLKKLR